MHKLKLFYPEHLFDLTERSSWFELLKSRQRFEEGNRPLDAVIQSSIEWVQDSRIAEIFILPHDWSYYYSKGLQKTALKFCKEADKNNRIVLSSSGGDQGITIPAPNNTIVYRQSGYRTKMLSNERAAPFFLSDPISKLLQKKEDEIFVQSNSELPIVGFCGMAPHGIIVGLKEYSRIIYRNCKSIFGLWPLDRQEIISSSNLRYKVLNLFKKSNYFKTKYIIRQKYRGGEQTPENRKRTTEEYYQNQIDSDLIICARGVGNFSVRFYETLAMGRIPVFIDTDSPLPDISPLDWHDYIIWIDRNDIKKAPIIAAQWLKAKNILEQKTKNRALWLEHFRLDNFWLRQLRQIHSKN